MKWLRVWIWLWILACRSPEQDKSASSVATSASKPIVTSPSPPVDAAKYSAAEIAAQDQLVQEARALQQQIEARRPAEKLEEEKRALAARQMESADQEKQAATDRAEAKKQAVAQAARAARQAKIADAVRAILRSKNPDAEVTATGTAIAINTPGHCDGPLLMQLRNRLK